MKKKKKSLLPMLALVCAVASLLLSALSLAAAPEDQSHLIDDLYQENKVLADRVEALESQLEQMMTAVNLSSWELEVTSWADSTGADVTLTAVPSGYQSGFGATFLVMLEGSMVASEPCFWDGGAFVATAKLSAADGYSYFCLLSTPTGSRQLPLTGPDVPDAGVPVYLQSGLSAYCNLVVNDWIENPGNSLVLTDAYAQVQLPQVSAGGMVEIVAAELVLRLNGTESVRIPVGLSPSEVVNSFDLTITDQRIPMPELKESDSLELMLEVELSDGRRLSAFGITWRLENDRLTSAVG